MTDEVGEDDTGIALEDRLRRKIIGQLLRDLQMADATMQSGDHGAPLFAVVKAGQAVRRLAELDVELGRFAGPAPDGVLLRLAHALAGLSEGTVDPMLKPAKKRRRRVVDAAEDKHQGVRAGPTANVLTARTTAAAAMELLMLAGRHLEDAASEVADILKSDPALAASRGKPERVIARWREEIMALGEKREAPAMVGHDVDFRRRAAGQFNFIVNETKRLVDAGAPPALLVEVAHGQLDHGMGMSGPR